MIKTSHLKTKYLALLTEQASLTDLMTELMGHAPQLTCLWQGRGVASPEERAVLDIPDRKLAHIREITMGNGEELWLFARTVIPMTTLVGDAKRLAKINTMPLGKLLFGRFRACREQLELDTLYPDQAGLEEFDIPRDFPLWQRRSLFNIQTGPIFIQEIFLPACPLYDNHEK